MDSSVYTSNEFAPKNLIFLTRAKSGGASATCQDTPLQPQLDNKSTFNHANKQSNFQCNIKQDHNIIRLGLQTDAAPKIEHLQMEQNTETKQACKSSKLITNTDCGYYVIPVGEDFTSAMQNSCQVRVTQDGFTKEEYSTTGLNKLIINLADRLEPDCHHNVTRCSLGPATGASISSDATVYETDSTGASDSTISTLDRKITTDDSRLIIRVPTPSTRHNTPLSINVSVSRKDPADAQNPLCASCNGVVPLSHLDSPLYRLKTEPAFWDAYPFRQSNLHRESSFHSSGGFTLNGHPGRINPKKHKIRRMCASHKVAVVVTTFSLLVTIALVITLLLMKKKGMMEPMR